MITKVTTFNLFLPSRVYFFDSSNNYRYNHFMMIIASSLLIISFYVVKIVVSPLFSAKNKLNTSIFR